MNCARCRKALRGEPSSRGTRLAACLKMAGDPPAAQVSKEARGFKDNNDHKDFKDARERVLMRPRSQSAGEYAPECAAEHEDAHLVCVKIVRLVENVEM